MSEKERDDFLLFLQSPYFNQEDLATLEQELSETPLLASRSWLQKMEKEVKG